MRVLPVLQLLCFAAAPALVLSGCAGKGTSGVPVPPIVTAADWDSTPSEFADEYLHEPRKILLHHAGVNWREGTDPARSVKNLQSWGMRERGWMDVPYHFLIAPDGRIFEGRALQYRPDTNTAFDPTGYINVQLWGNFEEQRVTREALASTVDLTAYLLDLYGLSAADVTTHLDVAPGQTTCPGRDFYRYVQDGFFGGWVEQRLKGGTPTVILLPALEDGPVDFTPI